MMKRICNEFCNECFLVNVSTMVRWIFLVLIELNGKTIKTPGFQDDAYFDICSICLRPDGPSLTEI